MGLHTSRNTCLACGRFWEESKITGVRSEMSQNCPYCCDLYYCDNCISDVPPPLGHHEIKCDGCGAEFTVETNDAKFCIMCKKEFKVEGGISQDEHQAVLLTKLGL